MHQPRFLSRCWVKRILGVHGIFIFAFLMERRTSQLFSYHSHLQMHPVSSLSGTRPLENRLSPTGIYVTMNYISLVYSQEVWNLNSFLLQTSLGILIPSTEICQTSVPFMVGLWFTICLKARAGTRWEGLQGNGVGSSRFLFLNFSVAELILSDLTCL